MSSGRYLVIFTELRGKYPPQATDTEVNNCFSENSEIIEHKRTILNSSTSANDYNFGAEMTERSSCFLADK